MPNPMTLNPDEIIYEEDDQIESLPSGQRKTYYLYELKKLIKGKSESLLTFSPNSVNLVIIDKDEYLKFEAWRPDAQTYEYRTKQSVSNMDGEVDIAQYEKENVYSYLDLTGSLNFENGKIFNYSRNKLYMVSEFILETDDDITNFGYLIQKIDADSPLTDNMNGNKNIEIVDLNTWAARDSNNAIFRIGKQLDSLELKELKITAPSSFLLSNLKVLGETKDGIELFPEIISKSDLIPIWVNPIEINDQGEVNLFNFWMTEDILPWEKAKNFLNIKEINDLIKGEDNNPEPLKYTYEEDEIESVEIMSTGNGQKNPVYKPPTTYPPFPGGIVWSNYNFDNELRKFPGSISYEKITKVNRIVINSKIKLVKSTLVDLLSEVLTASFNYKNNFKGAGYKDDQTGELNEMAKYKQEFEGKNITEYIDGLEKNWEQKYPDEINKELYRNYKAIRAMLSQNIFGSLSINQGLNEDNKILLPWFFELQTNPVWTGKTADDGNGIWKFKDTIKVKLKSSYFDLQKIFDNKNDVSLKNIISDSLMIKTNKDRFIWPFLPNQIDETQLPSLSVRDFKLEDENIGKFIVQVPKKWIDFFGNRDDLFKINYQNVINLNEETNLNYIFNLDTFNPKLIDISGIYGSGNWKIKLVNKDDKVISIDNLTLFKINKQNITRVKMII